MLTAPVLMVVALACADRKTDRLPQTKGASTAANQAVAREGVSDSVQVLVEKLKHLPGIIPDTGIERDDFGGNRETLIALSRQGENAVAPLVECLDRMDPAVATYKGAPVPMGFMCYQALRITATYEPTNAQGESDPAWPGILTAESKGPQLQAAKQAWTTVLRDKKYGLVNDK